MLTRYRLVRGRRPPDEPLPRGVRQDTRKHTRHCLRPDADAVRRVIADGSDAAWLQFARDYRALLERRFAEAPAPFERIAATARHEDVHLGCSCPSQANPDVRRCHTWLALEFMRQRFPELDVVFPE